MAVCAAYQFSPLIKCHRPLRSVVDFVLELTTIELIPGGVNLLAGF